MAYKQSPFPMIAGTSPVKGKIGGLVKLAKTGYKAVKNLLTKTNVVAPSKSFKYNIAPSKGKSGGYLRGKEGSYIPYSGSYTKRGQKITQDFTKKMSLNTPEAKQAYKFLVK